jgi:excisionase family DNA binding protein
MLTPLQAAKAVGASKATIHRAIKSGKLSAIRQGDGSFLIDPAELYRVYEPARDDIKRRYETANNPNETGETARLKTELDGARALQVLLEQQIEDLKVERDRWHTQAERLALTAPTRVSLLRRLFSKAA